MPQGFDFNIAELGVWLKGLDISPELLRSATIPNPTKRNLITWATAKGITTYDEMKDVILARLAAAPREGRLTLSSLTASRG